MSSTAEGDGSRGSTVVVPDESALAPLARRLAAALPPRAVITLEGDLGAGKTTFVKAVAAAVGIDAADVVSPTFGLIHVHDLPAGPDRSGRPDRPGRLVHADLYRLSGPADLAEIGWDEATCGADWIIVEWPQRIASALPADRLDITIRIDSETGRTFTFMPRGDFRLDDSWNPTGSDS